MSRNDFTMATIALASQHLRSSRKRLRISDCSFTQRVLRIAIEVVMELFGCYMAGAT